MWYPQYGVTDWQLAAQPETRLTYPGAVRNDCIRDGGGLNIEGRTRANVSCSATSAGDPEAIRTFFDGALVARGWRAIDDVRCISPTSITIRPSYWRRDERVIVLEFGQYEYNALAGQPYYGLDFFACPVGSDERPPQTPIPSPPPSVTPTPLRAPTSVPTVNPGPGLPTTFPTPTP